MEFIGDRISYLKKDDEFSIVISSAPNKKQGYYWMVWCFMWTFCGAVVLYFYPTITVREQKVMLIVFLGFWAYFEWKSVQMFLWKWKGREVIKIRPEGLRAGKRIYGSGKGLLFSYDGLQELKKITPDKSAPLNILRTVDMFARNHTIVLTYFGKDYLMGFDLKENDAATLFSMMKREIKKFKKD